MTKTLAHAEQSAVPSLAPPASRWILDVRVDATSYGDAAERIIGWAREGRSRYVCVASVNNVIEARGDSSYRRVMNGADLVTPDGMPLVWGLRMQGVPDATRVYGPDLIPVVCAAAVRAGVPVGFYGGHPDVLERMTNLLGARFPGLDVVFRASPPFRPLTAEEQDAAIEEIVASGAGILFVGLGAPKQERWMAEVHLRVPAVLVGVGAAFDFIAGAKPQAPRVIQNMGLEWMFRLASEPRRLWKRYTVRNPLFLALFARQLVLQKLKPAAARQGSPGESSRGAGPPTTGGER
jgi:N-acetylglucosaminyldiphosphoundecaprenol N-acetyl-beta-D-mannosaminyltransferase